MTKELYDLFYIQGATAVGCRSLTQIISEYRKTHASNKSDGFTALNTDLLPDWATTVIAAAFPYLPQTRTEGNISYYARGKDYHTVLKIRLNNVINILSQKYPMYKFSQLIDSGCLPEVYTAAACGIGVIGRNHLLILPGYGSWVFLGFILTDAPISLFDATECNERIDDSHQCINCGRCISSCPTGAVTPLGIDYKKCISAISQKKGELSENEISALAKSPLIWGCDICQIVCPMNRDVICTSIPEFEDQVTTLTLDELTGLTNRSFNERYPERAFTWRGVKPLIRNLLIN